MNALPVIMIFDVGKTNKKILLFDENYKVVFEESVRFEEISDEDGFPCEDIDALNKWVTSSLARMLKNSKYNVKALNFSAYGASFVYLDKAGNPILPLYNYLKPYPESLLEKFYNEYDGKEEFAKQSGSRVLGSLNSGLQLYCIKHKKPEIYRKIEYALHLPQYLSFIITRTAVSEITSIGCHTSLWNFSSNNYHEWVFKEGVHTKLAPIRMSDEYISVELNGKSILVGIGLHDSSSALIPYLAGFHEPFVLLSTGTWCITLDPFNSHPLSTEELEKDCLLYLSNEGKPVKASRIFTGYEHEQQAKRLAEHYGMSPDYFDTMDYDLENSRRFMQDALDKVQINSSYSFADKDLSKFEDVEQAYHELIIDIVTRQLISTKLILKGAKTKQMFVDGGFSKNSIYMHLLAAVFPDLKVFAASVPQASGLGAAMAMHRHWNEKPTSNDIVSLKCYSANQ